MFARITVRTPNGVRTFNVQTSGQYQPTRLGAEVMACRVVDSEGTPTDVPHVIMASREDVVKFRELVIDRKYGTLRQIGVASS